MYHCQPVLCEFMSSLYYYDKICSLHNKIRPRKWRCHSSMMLKLSFLCWPLKGGLGNLPVTLPRCQIGALYANRKSGYLIDLAEPPNKPFLRLEQRHSWPCQIKPNHTSTSSHPIFEHLKTWKKKTWFLEFWFHIKLARPSTGWFQGSPPWSRCHIYPRPPQTRQTFSSCSQKKRSESLKKQRFQGIS